MGIDTTIRFNDHNSYKITTDLLGYPFAVQDITHVTHSFQAYATAGLAQATRAKTLFFDADGAKLSEVSHDFAVTTIFEKVEITVAVPANARQAQLMLVRGTSDWWIAEPKSEQGEISTPFNVNYAGQMTYITPTGVYTGFIATHQIVVSGTASNPDETLETRLVSINQNAINVSATVSALDGTVSGYDTRITTIEAGQITLSSRVGAVEPKVTKITSAGIYTGEVVATQITSGYISADRIAVKAITGAKLADGTVTGVQIAASAITAEKIAAGTITGNKIKAGTITADKINVTNLSAVRIFQPGYPHITARLGSMPLNLDGSSYTGNGLAIFDSNYSSSTPLISLSSTGAYLSLSNRDKAVLWANEFATVIEGQHASNSLNVSYTGDIYMRHKISGSSNIHAIGVDENGPYYIKNSSTTYF